MIYSVLLLSHPLLLHLLHTPQILYPVKIPAYAPDIFPHQKHFFHLHPQVPYISYNMRDNTEYEANLFAADLILDDKEIADLSKNEDLNYFGLCSCLNSSPELMSFKLYSLIKRGQNYNMPLEIQSNFLAK